MFTTELQTSNPSVKLVKPDIERDAPLSMAWVKGKHGKNSLLLMGVPEHKIAEPTPEMERERIADFLTKKDELNWMIELNNQIVGSIWVDLKPSEYLNAPALHIMIGNPSARNQGVGKSATMAVIEHLKQDGVKTIYTRHLASNQAAAAILASIGFTNDEEEYTDTDDLTWQNARLQK